MKNVHKGILQFIVQNNKTVLIDFFINDDLSLCKVDEKIFLDNGCFLAGISSKQYKNGERING